MTGVKKWDHLIAGFVDYSVILTRIRETLSSNQNCLIVTRKKITSGGLAGPSSATNEVDVEDDFY